MACCIPWGRSIGKNGYGRVRLNGKQIYAHRYVWEAFFGKIPDGLFVLHHCDNRACIRPEHLFLGTQKDNIHDAIKKGRMTPLKHGTGADNSNSKLTLEQVKEIRSLRGQLLQRELADRFGVTQNLISKIQLNQLWRYR